MLEQYILMIYLVIIALKYNFQSIFKKTRLYVFDSVSTISYSYMMLIYVVYQYNVVFLLQIIHAHSGTNWKIISGHKEGQTQVDSPSYDSRTWWCHPIDIHFASKGIQGIIIYK